MPLTMANQEDKFLIKKISGKEEVRRFLENLGFVAGAEVSVVSKMGGNVIVQIKESRVAISKEMAQKIIGDKIMTLREVKTGQTVTVEKLLGEGAVKRRIMDMGITKGTEIYVRKVAPLGDPVEVTVRGYELSIRKADAELIQLK